MVYLWRQKTAFPADGLIHCLSTVILWHLLSPLIQVKVEPVVHCPSKEMVFKQSVDWSQLSNVEPWSIALYQASISTWLAKMRFLRKRDWARDTNNDSQSALQRTGKCMVFPEWVNCCSPVPIAGLLSYTKLISETTINGLFLHAASKIGWKFFTMGKQPYDLK